MQMKRRLRDEMPCLGYVAHNPLLMCSAAIAARVGKAPMPVTRGGMSLARSMGHNDSVLSHGKEPCGRTEADASPVKFRLVLVDEVPHQPCK